MAAGPTSCLPAEPASPSSRAGAIRRGNAQWLVLDTVTGGDAQRIYERLGWVRVGDIPRYALLPMGEPCSTTYYYRDLRA
jgi:hypothetical protein